MENVALWHERDISHSSVERMIGPDATVTLDFALARLAGVIDKLVVYPERMKAQPRPSRRPRAFAARAAGAHPGRCPRARTPTALVQRNAMKVWERGADFLENLSADPDVAAAPVEGGARGAMFDLGYHLKHVDTIFRRVFGKTSVFVLSPLESVARRLSK
jgi:adenylosuccinate lyase